MYDLSEENFKLLQESFAYINSLTLKGGENFNLASQGLARIDKIIVDIKKQGIKIDNTIVSNITKKEILP